MPNRRVRGPANVTPAEIRIAYLEYRENELLDAVATAAALVALADGRVEPVERGQLIDFLDRSEFLAVFTRGEILDVFERRVRELGEPGASDLALKRLVRHARRPLAQTIIDAGEEVATADCRLDARELRMLRLIRTILSTVPSPSDPGSGRQEVTQ